jgi:hypothetical protein
MMAQGRSVFTNTCQASEHFATKQRETAPKKPLPWPRMMMVLATVAYFYVKYWVLQWGKTSA